MSEKAYQQLSWRKNWTVLFHLMVMLEPVWLCISEIRSIARNRIEKHDYTE